MVFETDPNNKFKILIKQKKRIRNYLNFFL